MKDGKSLSEMMHREGGEGRRGRGKGSRPPMVGKDKEEDEQGKGTGKRPPKWKSLPPVTSP